MKTLRVFLISIIMIAFDLATYAQTDDHINKSGIMTESFKVWGKCDMCEARIEKSALGEGATSASWENKTQILTVSFDPSKTSKDAISKKLASVGHDTEKYKAPDEVYAKLPGCCHYERNK